MQNKKGSLLNNLNVIKLRSAAVLFLTSCTMLLSQGYTGSSISPAAYDFKSTPPIDLPTAYKLAVAHVGAATNRFFCITASCLNATNKTSTGWTFVFSNTNTTNVKVKVFFNGEVSIEPQNAFLLPN